MSSAQDNERTDKEFGFAFAQGLTGSVPNLGRQISSKMTSLSLQNTTLVQCNATHLSALQPAAASGQVPVNNFVQNMTFLDTQKRTMCNHVRCDRDNLHEWCLWQSDCIVLTSNKVIAGVIKSCMTISPSSAGSVLGAVIISNLGNCDCRPA